MLHASITMLVNQASWTIEDIQKGKSEEQLKQHRELLTMYENALKFKIQEYVSTRLSNIPDKVEELLNSTVSGQFDPRGDFPRYARECLLATLEICANECIKYLNIFDSKWRTLKYPDRISPVVLSTENGKFKDYLSTIALRVFDILQPFLQTIEIPTAVELATWLNSHVSYRNTPGEVSSNSDEEEEETDVIPGQAKSRVAGQINNKIIAFIFDRLREILLRDVERYTGKSEDFIHSGTSSQPSLDVKSKVEDDLFEDPINARLEKALGLGIQGAYPPVKVACRLLVYVNDLTFENNGENVSCVFATKTNLFLTNLQGSSEIAYEILHQTCQAVTRAADTVIQKFSQMDSRIFAIKNLVLLKNLVLAYEISGSHRASVLDFTDLWATFAELRVRGGLFDIASYYNLLTSGNLLPKVVENVQDARVELDGLLRENITMFREESAKMMLKERSSGKRGEMSAEKQIKKKLAAAYPQEEQLREGLWEAVQLLVDEKRRGN
jgi:hypothetical protein